MKRLFYTLVFAVLSVFGLASCSDEAEDVDAVNKQTILVFLPWSGSEYSQGLYTYFQANIDSICNGIIDKKGLNNTRVLVFLSQNAKSSTLYDLQYNAADKTVSRNSIKEYSDASYTTAEGFASLLNDVKTNAEALNYALIIGAHGCGWTYAEDWQNYPANAKPAPGVSLSPSEGNFSGIQFGDDPNLPLTRYFGSVSLATHALNVSKIGRAHV